MVIEETYRRAAAELHKEYPAVDAHLDLAGELLFRVQNKEENPLRGRYLEHLRAGGFRLIVSSVYLRDSELPEAGLRNALDQISVLLDEVEKNREFCMVRTREDMERALEEGRIGILLYMEGLDCIGKDLRLLRVLWELGVRGAFDVRATREMADCLANHIAEEYAAYHRIEIELVHEMFCVVIFGLAGFVKMNPRIEDDVLMKAIGQTLCLDMAPIRVGEG